MTRDNHRTGSPEWWDAYDAEAKGWARKDALVRRGINALGTLAVLGLLLSMVAALATGCATGRPPATPLHRASTAAVIFVEAGTLAGDVLTARIEADLVTVRDECQAQADASRDCAAAVRHRAVEYAAIVAAHGLYASLVNELVAELAAQARRQQHGDDPDLGDAIRLAGRALSVYGSLAEMLREIGIEAPAIPGSAVVALIGEVTP